MVTFETLIQNLQNIYFFSYFMPFIFVLAATYGIINKIELFDDDVVDASVSLAVGFMAMLGIYILNLGDMMVYFFGAISVGLVTILGFVLLAGMFGVDITDEEMNKKWIGIAGAIVIAILLIMVNEFLEIDITRYIFSEMSLTLLMIGGIIGFVYLLTKSGGDN